MENYKKQIEFVNDLGKVISGQNGITNVKSIEYKVFRSKDTSCITEYVVVTFKGGAISARNCTGNSQAFILSEISHLVKGGYYSEVEEYKNHLNLLKYDEIK